MANGLIPPGYRPVLLGQATTLEALGTVAPLEEGAAEGTLMLMRLDFAEFPAEETLNELEGKLRSAGVPAWPGYAHIVYADATQPSIYIAWQKGFAWMPIIIGILVLLVLPLLLGGLIWWLLPEPVKAIIEMMVMVGIMFLMMKFMSPMLEKGKEEESRAR